MKISLLLKIIPISLTVIGIATLIFLYVSISNERSIAQKESIFKQLGLDMMLTSDYLTEQARLYIQYGEKEYLAAYTKEVNETRTREAIIDALIKKGVTKNEIFLAENAFNLSVNLENLELKAFNLLDEQQFDAARAILFSNEYNLEKDKIFDQITLFQNALKERIDSELKTAQLISAIAFIISGIIFILSSATIMLVFRNINKKLIAVGKMSEITSKIAEGDFDFSSIDNNANDELSLLSNSFFAASNTIKSLVADVQKISYDHEQGDINARIDVSKYNGVYRQMTDTVNKMAASYSTMVYELSDTLRLFAAGTFRSTLQQYPGTKSEINDSVKIVADNFNLINLELSNLIQAASVGNFSTRSDPSRFSGDFASLLDGFNTLFESILRLNDAAPLAYAVLSDGVILEANAYARNTIGMTCGRYIHEYSLDLTDVDSNNDMLRKDGGAVSLRANIMVHNKEIHLFHVCLCRIESGEKNNVIFWGLDINEDEKKKDSLKRAHADFQKLIDSIPVPLFIAEPSVNEIIYCNNSYLNLFGFENLEEAYKFALTSLKQTEELNHNKITSSPIDTWDFQYTAPDGHIIDAKVFESEIIYNDIKSSLKIVQDLSIEKNKERLLLSAAEKEREANQLKNRFIVNMGHEIRTPMNAIIGLSRLALMKHQENDNYLTFKKIYSSAKGLTAIISDILDFSKLDGSNLKASKEPFVLEELIQNAFMLAAEQRGLKDITMLAQLSYELPVQLLGDRALVWQILKNLLDNAAKFTDIGRIILAVSMNRETDNNVTLNFRITDTGIGMDSYQLSRLFLPFEQFHNHSNEKVTGTGLGLSITQQIVTLLGGTISVNSQKDYGSEFEVILPFEIPHEYESIQTRVAKTSPLRKDVLVADSDVISIHLLQEFVIAANARPICLQNATSVIEQVQLRAESGNHFSIVFLDYRIDKSCEPSVSDVIKKYSPSTKLVLLSDFSKEVLLMDSSRKIDLSNYDEIIEKPFSPINLVERLSEMYSSTKSDKMHSYTQFKNAKVIICEDNQLNQEVAQNMLSIFGVESVIANNGFDALLLLNEDKYDLIFMDIIMPGLDGHEATKIIRSSVADFKDIKIVALTANAMQEEVEMCYKEGMNGYIVKPIDIDEVYSALLTHLPASTYSSDSGIVNTNSQNAEKNIPILSGIDVEAAIARFGGKQDRYFSALRRFVNDFCNNENLGDFNSVIASKNLQSTMHLVHNLKGVAGNLGINNVFTCAKDFERSLKDKAPSLSLYNKLIDDLDTVKNIITKKLPQQTAEVLVSLETGNDALCKEILEELAEALKSFEPSACEKAANKLRVQKWERIDAKTVKHLSELMDSYDFDGALTIIQKCLQREDI